MSQPCRSLITAALVFGSASALAEDAAEVITLPERVPPEVENLVVTEGRLEAALERTAVSAVSLDEGELFRSGAIDFEDVQLQVPGLTVIQAGPYSSVRMRGIGSDLDKGYEASTPVFVDGVLCPRISCSDFAFLDVASVEVLRGPQSTLFGASSVAGAMIINSRKALGEPDAGLDVSFSDLDEQRVHAYVNMPLAGAAIRAAGYLRSAAGEFTNTARDTLEGGGLDNGGRLHLRLPLSSQSSVSAGWSRFEFDRDIGISQLSELQPEQRAEMETHDPDVETRLDWQVSTDHPTIYIKSSDRLDLRYETALGDGQFSVTAASLHIDEDSELDNDFSPIPFVTAIVTEAFEQNSLDARFVSGRQRRGLFGSYQVGAHVARADAAVLSLYDVQRQTADPGVPDPGGTPPDASEVGIITSDTSVESMAVFGTLGLNLMPRWDLLLGLRYARAEVAIDQINEATTGGQPQQGPQLTAVFQFESFEESRRRRDDSLSPNVAIEFEATEAISLHLRHTVAHKRGGYASLAVNRDRLEAGPEQSRTTEFGMRAATRWLNAALTVFRTEFEDMQQTDFDGATFFVSNVPGAISEGVELNLSARLGASWSAYLNLGLLDARYTDFTEGPCPTPSDQPTCDQTGKALPGAPRSSGQLGLEYRRPLFAGLGLAAAADWVFSSERQLQADHDPLSKSDAWSLFNARISVGPDDGRWSLQLLGSNLGNEVVRTFGYDLVGQAGAHNAGVLPPRSLQLGLRLRY